MKFFLFFFFVLMVTSGLSQSHLPTVYDITNDTADKYALDDSYTQLLEDPPGELTIEQVSQSPLSNRFHANETKTKGIDYTIHTYWLRFRVRNTLNRDVTLYVSNIPAYNNNDEGYIEYFHTYMPEATGEWLVNKTGELVPWSQRTGVKHLQLVQSGNERR